MAAVTPDSDLRRYIMDPSNQIVSTRIVDKKEEIDIYTYQDGTEWVALDRAFDQFCGHLYLETALKASTVKHKISPAENRIATDLAKGKILYLTKYCGEDQPGIGTNDIDNEIKALREAKFVGDPAISMRKLGGHYYVVDTKSPNFDKSVHQDINACERKRGDIHRASFDFSKCAITPASDLRPYIMDPSNQLVSTRRACKTQKAYIHTYQDGTEWVQLNDDLLARDTTGQFDGYLYLETALKASTVKHKISPAEHKLAYNLAKDGILHLVKYCGEDQPGIGTNDTDNEIKALRETKFIGDPAISMRKLGSQYYVVDTKERNFDGSIHNDIAAHFRKYLAISQAFSNNLQPASAT